MAKAKKKEILSFLSVDRKYTNTEEGNRAIRLFNILAFALIIFFIINAIPFFWTMADMVGIFMIIEALLFLGTIYFNKKGYFIIGKNLISVGLIAGVITFGSALSPDAFAHILFYPVVISLFIIFNRKEDFYRNIYIVVSFFFFFLEEFRPLILYDEPPLSHQGERFLEFWIFLISFAGNGMAVYYFLELNYIYRNRIKNFLGQKEELNEALSKQSNQLSESLKELSKLNQQLELNEKRFRFLAENSKDIIGLMDNEGLIQYVSNSIHELLGMDASDMEHSNFNKLVYRDDIEIWNKVFKIGKGELRLLHKSGKLRWFEIVVVDVNSEEFSGFQFSARDISDRKKVEIELQSNRSMLERIAETTPNFLYVFHHPEKRITYLNRSIWEYLGYGNKELFEMDEYESDLIHPDDKIKLENQYKQLTKSSQGKVILSVYRMKSAKGRWVWFESRDTVLEKTRDQKDIVLSLGEARDITAIKENETFLLKKQNELLSFVQAAPAAIAMLDKDLCYIAASKRWYEDYKLENQNILGKSHYEVFPEVPEHWKKIHKECVTKGIGRKEDEELFERENGEKMWIRWEVIPWFRTSDEIGGIIMLTEDITVRKKEKEELEKAKHEAEEASEAKAQFLSTMSHEIRTPLNSVIGMSNLLLSEDPKEEQVENLKALNFGAQNLMALINDILDFSKIEAGRIRLENTTFNVHELLRNLRDSFKVLVKDKDLKIDLDLEDKVPEHVLGDPTRLSQILNNLVGNSVKFTHKGSVTISCKLSSQNKQKIKLEFTVKDTGIGIPKDKQEIIFDSFSQASSETTRKYGGTGLGLAITKRLVSLYSGSISLESELNKGTSFKITLPFEAREVQKESKENQVLHSNNGRDEELTIMLVEDNKMNQLVAGKFLKKWGMKYVIAENGKEAVDLIKKDDFDLILMDLHMPEMDGYEATRQIRSLDSSKSNIPIVALSASASPGVKERIHEFHMNGFVTKPFDPAELLNTIRNKVAENSDS